MPRDRLQQVFEHQNFVLLIIGLVMAAMFALSTFAANAYHSRESRLGREWFERGQTELRQGNATPAVQAFRNALAYENNAEYRRQLAAGLAASGDTDEAREYLLNLWDNEPGDGSLNLQLARLAARTGNTDQAVGYYHNAVYGVWPEDPEDRRREVRIELARFLIANNRRQAARADLIALAADLPADQDLYTTVGRLFLQVNDPASALAQSRMALRLNRNLAPALFSAGEAAYELAEYRVAQRYLEQALRIQPSNADGRRLYEMASLIVSLDPNLRGLTAAERNRRVVVAYQQALSRIESCAQSKGISPSMGSQQSGQSMMQPQSAATTTGSLQVFYSRLQQLAKQASPARLQRNPDLADDIMNAVNDSESAAASVCGRPSGKDLALLLLAQEHTTE